MYKLPRTAIFFDTVRPMFPSGMLKEKQVEGMEAIIDGWFRWAPTTNVTNLNQLAYVLATAKRETGSQMQPVKETQFTEEVPSDDQVKVRLTKAWREGRLPWVKKDYWSSGWFGRGLVQLTHEFNYKGEPRRAVLGEFAVDIYKNPSLLLQMPVSVYVLVVGSCLGWFTGKDLDDYIDSIDENDKEDAKEYRAARRVINGQDAADEIAVAAVRFENALRLGGFSEVKTIGVQRPATAPVPRPAPETQPKPSSGPMTIPGAGNTNETGGFTAPDKNSRPKMSWGWIIFVLVLVVAAAAAALNFNPS